MTFSDKSVRKLLQREFVLTWLDLEGDEAAGSSFAHPPSDPAPSCIRGNGEHNVQLLVVTPAGEIVHALAGFISPTELLEELEFALEVFEGLDTTDEDTIRETLVAPHMDFAERLADREWEGLLGDWEQRRAIADHRWVARHPLARASEFETEHLVGNATTFFGASSGQAPERRIGDGDPPELPPRN